MIKRDVTGRISRTITTAQLVSLIGALQAVLAVSGLPIPPEYQWVQGVGLVLLGKWVEYLRMNTTTPMQ